MASVSSLGIKRICPECGARFYDLNRRPAACPKCGHSFDPTQALKPKRARKTAEAGDDILVRHMNKPKLPPKKKAEEEESFEDLEAGGGVEPALEEIDEMDEDIETLEKLEDINEDEEEQLDEELVLEGEAADGNLIDAVSDEDEVAEEEEEEAKPSKPRGKGKKK